MGVDLVGRLDGVSEDRARRLNLLFSSLAGATYLFLLLNFEALDVYAVLGFSLLAIALDFSTVYFVHSGVLSGTLERVMSEKQASRFMKLHLWPGMAGYLFLLGFLVSLFFQPVYLLFYVFLAGWIVMYLSGLYAYTRLR